MDPATVTAGLPGFVPTHGIGGASDLPLPLTLTVVAGTAALIISFCVLALAWRRPRYVGHTRGRPLPVALAGVIDHPLLRWSLRALGLVGFGYVTWAAVAGPDRVVNPTFGVFYVMVWVGIVPASLLFGPIVRAVSPVRTITVLIARLTGGDPGRGLVRYPTALGYWPAALTLFAYVWQELVNPENAYLGSIRLWLALYLAVMVIGASVFGETWLARADPFEVFGSLVARLSPWGRDADGAPVVRSPLANLALTETRPGLVAVVAVLFGSTAFDSFQDTLQWLVWSKALPGSDVVQSTAGLIGLCLIVGLTFTLAARLTGTDQRAHGGTLRAGLPALFAPSVVPIIVGYYVAHYLTYFVEQGQSTLIQLSDPMVNGSNLLGTADWSVNYGLSYHPTLLAVLKVAAVVLGHIVGVVAAHDRAVAVLPVRHQVTGQLAMLVVMVGYTVGGLYLLFSS